MDWIIIASTVIAGWMMLSVFSGERMNKAQQLAIVLAKLAADQARERENEIPIAMTPEPAAKAKR
jgi:hypothetical protein